MNREKAIREIERIGRFLARDVRIAYDLLDDGQLEQLLDAAWQVKRRRVETLRYMARGWNERSTTPR